MNPMASVEDPFPIAYLIDTGCLSDLGSRVVFLSVDALIATLIATRMG